MDGCRLRTPVVHTKQLDGTLRRGDANGRYHGIGETGSKTSASTGLRLVQDGSKGGACCSLVEIETETLCETWSEFARVETKQFLAKTGLRDADRLENWAVMAPLLLEVAGAHKLMETKEMTGTELELKTFSVAEEKRRTTLRASGAQADFAVQFGQKRRALKWRKHLIKIKESAATRKAPKNTHSNHFNWSSIAEQENPKQFSQASSNTSVPVLLINSTLLKPREPRCKGTTKILEASRNCCDIGL